MNFKIETNFLDITNSPAIEEYLEKRAREGWLIDRIFIGSLFIFKKVKPTNLVFSISPYEIETAFTRRKKSEIKEFQELSETVGWNYVTKTYDLHVYYKEEEAEAIPIQTDEEEEFKILDRITGKRIKAYWIQTFMLLFFTFLNSAGLDDVRFLKDGGYQLVLMIIPIGLVLAVWGLIHMYNFRNKNRKNREQGKSIEYSQSNFLIPKISFYLAGIFISFIIIHYLYLGLALNNSFILYAFLPVIIGFSLATIYRFFVKPAKISIGYKKLGFGLTLLATVLVGAWTGIFNVNKTNEDKNEINTENYQVLTAADFSNEELDYDEDLTGDFSLLVPESYEYFYINKDDFVVTQYGRALTESLAKNMVERYKEENEKYAAEHYHLELNEYFEEGVFDDYLLTAGIREEHLFSLNTLSKDEAVKLSKELIREQTVHPTNEDWQVDEAYYLSYQKEKIVFRKGKEVYYLEGKDFSEEKNKNIVKKEFNL